MLVPGKMSAGFHEVIMWFGCHKGLRGFREGKIGQLHEIGEARTVKYCIMYYGKILCDLKPCCIAATDHMVEGAV